MCLLTQSFKISWMTPIRCLALAPAESRCYTRLYQKTAYKLRNCHKNANNHKLPFIFTRIENCVFLVAIGLISPGYFTPTSQPTNAWCS